MRSQAEEEAVRILIGRYSEEFQELAWKFEDEIERYGGISR